MVETRPVIITLQIDRQAEAFFQAARARYFPRQINFVGAHLTLFHNLPGEKFSEILRRAAAICAVQASFTMDVTGLMRLGRGVAYKIQSDDLLALRTKLSNSFDGWLRGQDRQSFRPHVTVQNKVAAHQAVALFDYLEEQFEPFTAIGEGLQFWFYEGGGERRGTWASAGAIAFADQH